ncbi:MAG: hypothetical protein AAF384_03175 [Pseudomonadota bacterium]
MKILTLMMCCAASITALAAEDLALPPAFDAPRAQAAADACDGAAQGAVCSFEGRRGYVDGRCELAKNELRCRGESRGGGQFRQPPQFAIDACRDLPAGTECSVSRGNRTRSGSCTQIGDVLACKPDRQRQRDDLAAQ